MPGLGCQACCSDHICQLADAVIGEGSHAFLLPSMNADAAAVGQIVIVADDCLEEVLVFATHFRRAFPPRGRLCKRASLLPSGCLRLRGFNRHAVPRQQCVETVDLVIVDAVKNVGQTGLGIKAVEFGAELSLKVGDGEIGWHIKALLTRRRSR